MRRCGPIASSVGWCGHVGAHSIEAVGVDGSSGSLETLLVADAEARWRNARLEAVLVYAPTSPLGDQPSAMAVAATVMWTGTTPGSTDPGDLLHASRVRLRDQARGEAVRRLAGCVAAAELDRRRRPVDQTVVTDTRPARALLRIASHADLLVLGAAGRAGVRGRLPGAVSRQCLRHAACPVLVVGHGPRSRHERATRVRRCCHCGESSVHSSMRCPSGSTR